MPDNKLDILPLTIKVRMDYNAMRNIAREWYETYAKDNDMDDATVAEALLWFLSISARVPSLNGLADFELSTRKDTPEQQRAKFEGFVNSGRVALVEMLQRRIEEADKPDKELFGLEGEA